MKDAMPTTSGARRKIARDEPHHQTVIICDDHAAIRAGVSHILEQRDKHIVGACGAVPEFLQCLASPGWALSFEERLGQHSWLEDAPVR